MTEPSAPSGSTFRTGRSLVDGVTALWADLPLDPTMTLVFGVGYEDMDPRTVGITHLVEHLVMRRVGRVRIPHNAESGLRSTSFYATGPADQLCDFLERVCAAVADLEDTSAHDLETERRTVLAEIGPAGLYATHDAFTVRYGARGTGLAALAHTRLMDWDADEVRETARRWFHRGNAWLTSTTPLPPQVSLARLPDGPAPGRPAHPVSLLDGPSWTEHSGDDLVLAGECSTTTDPTLRMLALSVLTDVLTQTLRTAQGEVYSVDGVAVQVDDARDAWALSSEPGPERACDVLVASLDVLDRLADHGPSPDELEDTRSSFLHETHLAGFSAGWLDATATQALRGFRVPTPTETREVLRSADGAAVARVVAELRRTLLVCFPAGHVPHEGAIARLDGDGIRGVSLLDESEARAPRGGSRHRGRFFSPGRGLEVTLLPDRFVLAEPGRVTTIPTADLVLAGTDEDGDVELVTRRGGIAFVVPSLFRGLERPLAEALDRLPPDVRYVKSRRGAVADALAANG